MAEPLIDIEALALSCRSEQSREYVAEALRCYRAGSFRATIVTVWIAVVFDLIDKVRELALSGDNVAKTLEAKYENYIAQIEEGNDQGKKNALQFERAILETCREQLEFFDTYQMTDLVRLRDDRHRCAHPSFQRVGLPYEPSAEHARLHLRNAIVHVLAQPPVQGKAALAELKATVASTYFPKTTDKALAHLRTTALNSATDAFIRSFVDMLVFGFLTSGNELYHKKQAISALCAAKSLYPEAVETRLKKQLNKAIDTVRDSEFDGAVCLVIGFEGGWELLEQAAQEKVRHFVIDGPKGKVLPTARALNKIDGLKGALGARMNSLEFDDLVEAIDEHDVGALAKSRALYFLSKVGSWERANTVIASLILPLFDHLDVADVERIICMPTTDETDLPGAHGYRLFIKKVREANLFEDQTLNQLLSDNSAEYLVPQYGA